MIKPIPRTEAEEQQAVIDWALYNETTYPCLKWLHHIPNGGAETHERRLNSADKA